MGSLQEVSVNDFFNKINLDSPTIIEWNKKENQRKTNFSRSNSDHWRDPG